MESGYFQVAKIVQLIAFSDGRIIGTYDRKTVKPNAKHIRFSFEIEAQKDTPDRVLKIKKKRI